MSNPATQFKPGESGNLKGRPKRDWTWSGELQKAVEKAEKSGKTLKEIVANSLIHQAKRGNIQAQKELMNRMDGMPQASVDLTTKGKELPTPIYSGRSKNEG